MIDTAAEAPAYRPDGVPVTSMTTGKVATPELVLAMRPIEATLPWTGPAAPSVVITTWSPVLIWPTTVALTFALITSLALITVIDELELLEPVPPDPPPLPSPPPPLPPPPPDPPLTCWPMVRPAETTMPLTGDVSVVPARAALAVPTWDWAALTDDWSAAS